MTEPSLTIRDLGPAEIGVRIAYFHGATDDHLARMGVDRSLLPPPDEWAAWYEADLAKPRLERETATVGWYVDDRLVGFGTIDRITPGTDAFFHLHVLDATERGRGLGRRFVRLSAVRFDDLFDLPRLFSEPNAYNQAPNRTLQAAGFRYLFTHDTKPGRIKPAPGGHPVGVGARRSAACASVTPPRPTSPPSPTCSTS